MVKYPNAASGIKKVFLAKIIGVIGVPPVSYTHLTLPTNSRV